MNCMSTLIFEKKTSTTLYVPSHKIFTIMMIEYKVYFENFSIKKNIHIYSKEYLKNNFNFIQIDPR